MGKALVVDDEPLIRKSLSMALTLLKFDVDSADCGLMGESLWLENDYDLIFLDILMPDKSGLEVLKTIMLKKNMRFDKSVVLISAYSREEIIPSDVSSLGAAMFLQKPFENIFDTVSHVISSLGIS